MKEFESAILERAKGSEFELVLNMAHQGDKQAQEILKDRNFQKRLFVFIRRRDKSPEDVFKAILVKAGAAIAIVLFEKMLRKVLKT